MRAVKSEKLHTVLSPGSP